VNFNLTLIAQSVAFVIFVWFTMTFVWPMLIRMMAEREKRIADGLAAADEGQKKLVDAEQEYRKLVDEGRKQASTIVSQAQKRSGEIVEEAKNTARIEAERIIETGRGEIQKEREQAREQLRARVAELALAGAEPVLMREVDKKTHNEVLTKISAGL